MSYNIFAPKPMALTSLTLIIGIRSKKSSRSEDFPPVTPIDFICEISILKFNKILESFCQKYNIDYNVVKLLGALHYLNIAEFYKTTEQEYSKFIFLLGKLLMSAYLNKLKK